MLTDWEISRQAQKKNILELASQLGINQKYLTMYGEDKAKIDLKYLQDNQDKPDGKLILVTAINPTPSGEGKSTTTIGLVDSLNAVGKKAIGAIREPSLGPVFGIKGGAAGGGYSQVNPMVDLNLHFTGDLHAITTANNLISAIIDNHIYHGNALNIDPEKIVWKRCLDLNDRALRKVMVGLDSKKETPRYDSFNITVASEIMAILCLATSIEDLRNRLDNTLVAYTKDNKPIFIKDLQITGSLLVLLKDAIKPNIVQTLENNLMLVHGGPFANIAHGCNSLLATKMALKMADYVVTEAGFGADLGAEKFLDIKCQVGSLKPNLVVLVSTIRALKYHGGMKLEELKNESLDYLQKGIENLEKHIETIQLFGLKCVVAVNKFASDTDDEINFIRSWAKSKNIKIALSEVFSQGSQGGLELAKTVLEEISSQEYKPLYSKDEDLFEKITRICKQVYGAKNVIYLEQALADLTKYNNSEYKNFYICMAKTPNSLSDNPKLIGRPRDFDITIREIRIATGAQFIICLTGSIMTMPGLPKEPLALKIDLDENYEVIGLS